MSYTSDFEETRRQRMARNAEMARIRAMRGGSRAANGAMEMVREHPIPTALVGLGLGWLAVSLSTGREVHLPERERLTAVTSRARAAAQRARARAESMRAEAKSQSGEGRRYSEEVLQRANETAEIAEARARRAAASMRHYAEEYGQQAESYARAHPFMVGAVAFGLGAAIGGLMPRVARMAQSGGGHGHSHFDWEDEEDYGGAAFAEGDLQGEGDYRAAHHYRESTEDFAEHGDPGRRAREAAADLSRDPETYRKAEAAGRKPAQGSQTAGSGTAKPAGNGGAR